MLRQAILMVILAAVSVAQVRNNPEPAPAPQAAQPADPNRQTEQDLNHMESLLNNMAAETAFIHDTNMQILLNTNYQLWSILLRDLRMQLQQQKKTAEAPR
jgi:RecA/RadA recombinase